MKKISFLLLILIGILISSCDKNFLNVSPLNQLSDATFWKTENDATLALNPTWLFQFEDVGLVRV